MTKKLDHEDFLTFEEIFYDPNRFKKIKRRRSYARKRGGKREGEELEESKLKGIFGDPNRQIVQFQCESMVSNYPDDFYMYENSTCYSSL